MQLPWMAEQESNLVYVAYTRAKEYLGFIQDFDKENRLTDNPPYYEHIRGRFPGPYFLS